MEDLPEPEIDSDCPAEKHGFQFDDCICIASWLNKRADAVDEQWANYEGGPWDE